MSRSDDKFSELTSDALDEALSALDFEQPAKAAEPARVEPQSQDPIFEADPAVATPQPPAEPARTGYAKRVQPGSLRDEVRSNPDEGPAPAMVRDASGNRVRIESAEGDPRDDRRMLVQMYGLPPDLERRVLHGGLNLQTALAIRRRRAGETGKAGRSGGLQISNWVIVVSLLVLAASVGMLLMVL